MEAIQTSERNSVPGSSRPRTGIWPLLALLWCWCWCPVCGAQNDCDDSNDVTVAVVVSVFVTLLVVAIVLVIVYFVLRRRHGGFLFPPKRTRKSLVRTEERGHPTFDGDSCYDNPAFSTRDTVDLEEGRSSVPPSRLSSPAKTARDGQKTWSSFPPEKDVPDGMYRKGSCGSLDTNCVGPETVSVWLQSQDIIGLGFNISGNMRDGIYVSQVHNRGPAVESGMIQVGDRIRSVTISYDNMVYEDALTILSYASPYPVRVTLQKERTSSGDSLSGSMEQLNHPLYRSQSLDALHRIHKEPPYKPKRTKSEMKPETRKDSPLRSEEERGGKVLSQSLPHFTSDPLVHSHAMVHSVKDNFLSDGFAKTDDFPSDGFVKTDDFPSDVFSKTNDFPSDGFAKTDDFPSGGFAKTDDLSSERQQLEPFTQKKQQEEDTIKPERREDTSCAPPSSPPDTETRTSKLNMEAAQEFVSLMDLSLNRPEKKTEDDIIVQQSAGIVSNLPKTPPDKPQRKSKPSSISFASDEESTDGFPTDAVEEVFEVARTGHVEALPSSEQELGSEVEEEEIQPTFVKRELVITAEGFEFTPKEKYDSPTESDTRPDSPRRYIYVSKSLRSTSPEGDPVEEDIIEAVAATRDTQATPASHISGSPYTRNHDKMSTKNLQPAVLDDKAVESIIIETVTAEASCEPGNISEDKTNEHDFVFDHNVKQVPTDQKLFSKSQDEATSFFDNDKQQVHTKFSELEGVVRPMWSNLSPPGQDDVLPSVQSDSQLVTRSKLDHEDKENRDHSLDWSGKRLVRSGSFSEIPQDDSVSDWLDRNTVNDSDNNSLMLVKGSAVDISLDSDLEADPSTSFPSRDIFKARENLSNLTDSSSSFSSSENSSPPLTNGPSSELGLVGSGKTAMIELTPTSDKNANSKTFRFSVDASTDDDADC